MGFFLWFLVLNVEMRFGCCQMQGRIYSVRPRAVGHPKNWEKSSTICLHTLNRKLMELTRQKKQRGIAFDWLFRVSKIWQWPFHPSSFYVCGPQTKKFAHPCYGWFMAHARDATLFCTLYAFVTLRTTTNFFFLLPVCFFCLLWRENLAAMSNKRAPRKKSCFLGKSRFVNTLPFVWFFWLTPSGTKFGKIKEGEALCEYFTACLFFGESLIFVRWVKNSFATLKRHWHK